TKIEVGFLKFIRPEKKFDSVEDLKVQIEKDVATALMI
ncbi:MAG: riboflavin biosynthesis protein RibF, partial [Kiritimatiellae bacterium]|nr:riboflavin biosynthesis protein RibF [Kiritimatiellia bacterium]